MAVQTLRLGLTPIFLFFFDCYVKLDWIKAHDFQLRTAIIAFDDVALIGVFVNLDFSIAFGARSSWHVALFLRDH